MVLSRTPGACGISHGSVISGRLGNRSKGGVSFLGQQKARAPTVQLRS